MTACGSTQERDYNRPRNTEYAMDALNDIFGIYFGVRYNTTVPTDNRIYNNIISGHPVYSVWTSPASTHAMVIRGISTGYHLFLMNPTPGVGLTHSSVVNGQHQYTSAASGNVFTLTGHAAKLR